MKFKQKISNQTENPYKALTSIDFGRSEGFPRTGYFIPVRYGLGVRPAGKIVGAPPPSPPPSASVGFTGGYRPPYPRPCLISKGMGLQNVRSHTRMLGPSVFSDSSTEGLARGRVFRMLSPIPECLVLQCFQIKESYQNAWSFSISRFTGHTRMLGPSVFPDSRIQNPVLRFKKIHSLESVATSDPPDYPIRSVSSSQYRRNPRGLKSIPFF